MNQLLKQSMYMIIRNRIIKRNAWVMSYERDRYGTWSNQRGRMKNRNRKSGGNAYGVVFRGIGIGTCSSFESWESPYRGLGDGGGDACDGEKKSRRRQRERKKRPPSQTCQRGFALACLARLTPIFYFFLSFTYVRAWC